MEYTTTKYDKLIYVPFFKYTTSVPVYTIPISIIVAFFFLSHQIMNRDSAILLDFLSYYDFHTLDMLIKAIREGAIETKKS